MIRILHEKRVGGCKLLIPHVHRRPRWIEKVSLVCLLREMDSRYCMISVCVGTSSLAKGHIEWQKSPDREEYCKDRDTKIVPIAVTTLPWRQYGLVGQQHP